MSVRNCDIQEMKGVSMKKFIKKVISFMAAGTIAFSAVLPAISVHAETNSDQGKITQFMDCFLPMPIVDPDGLSEDCWGTPTVGPRDQKNGIEDPEGPNYSYWDGGIIQDEETGTYYMFASRWKDENGHSDWMHSDAIYATSENFYGPYEDQGKVWPEDADGAGHNVFPFELSEQDPLYGTYKYAIVTSDSYKNSSQVNGAIHVSNSLEGPWESLGIMQSATSQDLYRSNICIIVRADGKYQTINRNGDIWTADSVAGPWTIESTGLWWNVEGMPTSNVEDPVMWYSDGYYHVVANKWDTKQAFYLTSEDGLTGWVRHSGFAYAPNELSFSYENGVQNKWTKLERPNVYIEDGKLTAMTFAVIDVEKEQDKGNDAHGSKIIIVPFDGESLKEFAKTDVYVDPFADRAGLEPIADTNIQSWNAEFGKNYGGEQFLQLQRDGRTDKLFDEGERAATDLDSKIAFIKYDLSEFMKKDIDSAVLSLVYIGKHAGRASEDSIRAVLADSDWIEGIGIEYGEGANGNSAEGGGMTWQNQPALYYDLQDMENTVAVSEPFKTDLVPSEIKIDVTKLVKQFIEKNPDASEITFALCETETGNRLRIGSKEGGNTKVPKLAITVGETPSPSDTNKMILNKVIEKAEALMETEEFAGAISSVQESFTNALAEAKDVAGDDYATQQQVDAAWVALMTEIHKLGLQQGDKNALQQAYDLYRQLDLENYIDDAAKTNFIQALADAEAMLENHDAVQSEVDAVTDALVAAADGMTLRGVKTSLEALVNSTLDYDANDYAVGWEAFENARTAANAVLADKNATQDDVDTAFDTLLQAMMDLRFKADKEILNKVIQGAKTLDLSGYTPESVEKFKAALNAADRVSADESLSEDDQPAVDQALNELNAAIAGLTKADGTPANLSVDGDGNITGASGSAKTGDTTPVAAAAALLLLAGSAATFLRKKHS